MKNEYFLGIDVSTTGSKVLLMDGRGDVIAVASSTHTLQTPKPLWSEQSPEEWWTAVSASILAVLDKAGASGECIQALGLTGQMHGVGLLGGFILSKLSPAWERRPLPGIPLGLLAACVLYGALHAANYGMSRTYLIGDMALSMKEAGGEPDMELAGLLLDGILMEKTGYTGYPGLILLSAQHGSRLDILLADLDIAPNPLFAWGYWLLEWAIIAWLTVCGAYRKAQPAPVPALSKVPGKWYRGVRRTLWNGAG